jgi:hypothetical protein
MGTHSREGNRLTFQYLRTVALFAILAATFGGSSVLAQTTTGRIVGTVTDESGAVIPGVVVGIRNPDTGLTREVLTNESGNYAVSLLPPAVYEAQASLPGFRQEVRSGVTVQVDAVIRLDFALHVGTTTDKIEVTADAPLLQSETASLGQVMDSRKVTEMPLNARHVMSLTLLTPGVMPIVQGSNLGTQNLSFHAMGARERDEAFLLDGVSAQDPGTQQLTITPSIDAIEEFKLQASTYGAEFGRSGGGVLNIQTKSGANAFHAVAFEFLRNDLFDARNFFATTKPPYHRNQYGTVLSGPIKKDRAFFMFNWEGSPIRQVQYTLTKVPTGSQRSGDFSDLGKQIIDPLTRQPFPGNIIPADRLDPTGQKIAAYYPLSNRATTNGSNYLTAGKLLRNFNTVTGRTDFRISERQSVFARVSWQDTYQEDPNFGLGSNLPGFGLVYFTKGRNVALSDTYIFGPRVVNEFRVGFNRLIGEIEQAQYQQDLAKQLGITGVQTTYYPGFGLGFPTTNVSGYASLNNNRGHQRFPDNVWHFFDTMNVTHGNHVMKIGGEFQTLMFNWGSVTCPNGCFTYDGRYSGNAYADLLLGYPAQTQRSIGYSRAHERMRVVSGFFQDDWKATSKLTLNLGVRYDFQTPPVNADGDFSVFDPITRQVVIGGKSGPQTFPNLLSILNDPLYSNPTITLAGGADYGIPRGLYKPDLKNFSPRLGFAWSPEALHTVIRGGYGIFVTPEIPNVMNPFHTGAYPWVIPQTFNGDATTPNISLRNPFPSALAASSISTAAIELHKPEGYVQQWNLGIQRQLGTNMMIDISYAASKGTHILGSHNINRAALGPGSIASRRPIQGWGDIIQTERNINTNFNSLQAKVERRFSSGATFVSAYTWSHAIDNGGPSQGGSGIQNDNNLRAERGNAVWDYRHRWVNSYSYELPFGNGKAFLSGVSGIASHLISGWQVAGISTFSTGQSFDPIVPGDISLSGGTFVRPNRICDGMLPRGQRTPQNWINPACFVTPPTGTFGNSGRNVMKAPGMNNWDLTLMKNIRIGETQKLEFRAEFFDAFNQTHFGVPENRVNQPTFGSLITASDGRDIQFGLKYSF